MAVRFDYPANGWSNARMRKRGEKLAYMEPRRKGEPESALVEMERAAGMGLAARGGVSGPVDVSGIGKPPVKGGAAGGLVTKAEAAEFNPKKMSDEELRKYYEDAFNAGRPATLHGSEREFNIYMDVMKKYQKGNGAPDAQSPR